MKKYSSINERKEDITERDVRLALTNFCEGYHLFDFEYSHFKLNQQTVVSFRTKFTLEKNTEVFFYELVDLLRTQADWKVYPVMATYKFLFTSTNIEEFLIDIESRVNAKKYNL